MMVSFGPNLHFIETLIVITRSSVVSVVEYILGCSPAGPDKSGTSLKRTNFSLGKLNPIRTDLLKS